MACKSHTSASTNTLRMGQNTWQLRHLRSSSPQVIRAEIAQIELGDIERNARSHETAPTGVERVQQQSYRVPVGRHNQWLCVPMKEADWRTRRRGRSEPLNVSKIVSPCPSPVTCSPEMSPILG